jgi:SagB-type dehydrogenase family enzyme
MDVSMADDGLIGLPPPVLEGVGDLGTVLRQRRSVRAFEPESLTLSAIAKLLWAAQGITSDEGLRATPSAGALYPLELHLIAGSVDGLPAGSYRYDPYRHALEAGVAGDQRTGIAAAALHQDWVAQAAVIVVVTAVDARTTRKYGRRGIRYVQMEVGHASQNLLLAATALGLGGTIVGAFDDDRLGELLRLRDGERPLAILAVGRPRR